MKQTIVPAILFLMVYTNHLSGQTNVIDIWQGKVPGALTNSSYKQSIDSEDNWVKMRNVTTPMLDMYLSTG